MIWNQIKSISEQVEKTKLKKIKTVGDLIDLLKLHKSSTTSRPTPWKV